VALVSRLLDPRAPREWPPQAMDPNEPARGTRSCCVFVVGGEERVRQALRGEPYENLSASPRHHRILAHRFSFSSGQGGRDGRGRAAVTRARCTWSPRPSAISKTSRSVPLGTQGGGLVACETRAARVPSSPFRHTRARHELLRAQQVLKVRPSSNPARGQVRALVTDAGTPGSPIRFPSRAGKARAAGFRGAGAGALAVVAALSAAGIPADSFVFDGFLPVKPGQRLHRLESAPRSRDDHRVLRVAPSRARSLEAIGRCSVRPRSWWRAS